MGVLKPLTHSRWSQVLLENVVLVAQYLQGIASGGDVESSGEKAVFAEMNSLTRSHRPLCVFDVGANVGQYLSLACSCLADREFTIHSFEPSRTAFASLSQSAAGNPNVQLNNFGLGREAGEADLYYNAPGSGLASLTKRNLSCYGIEMDLSEKVRISTVDNYCREHGIEQIDLLKIDVEGHELDVLNGATRMFRSGAIEFVTIEFGGCNIDTRTFVKDFFFFFRDHSMGMFRITPSGHLFELKSYHERLEQFRTTNFFCRRV
jgi:FkbM family methyltransferase